MYSETFSKSALVLILILGFFLRVYQVGQIPPSFSWDEVATGYDAYSLLQTGKDQFGNFLPLSFRSLDDYKPPVYTYLAALSIKILGWNDLAVRFPSVLLGTLSILGTYILVQELFHSRKLALLSSMILAISPWHTHFSRLALESNNVIFFTTFATWFFHKGLTKSLLLPLSVIFFGLGMFTYHSARFVIPIILCALVILNFKKIKLRSVGVWVSGIISLLIALQVIKVGTSISGQMRFTGASIFTPVQSLQISKEKEINSAWQNLDAQRQDRLGRFWHNDILFYSTILVKNYFKHLDPNFWLFADNDTLRHHVQGIGIIYFIELPLLILGWYFLINKTNKKVGWLILIWFLSSVVPSAVTRDVPHAMRIAVVMPLPQVLIALGLFHLIKKLTQKQLFGTGIFIISSLYLLNSAYFLHQYFIHYPIDSSEDWRYGRRQAAQFAEANKNKYDKILVSTNLEYPHVFFLYYLRYEPRKYLAEGGTVSGGWGEVTNKFDKYYFQPFDYGSLKENNYLFIGKPEEFAQELTPLKKIKYLNDKDAIWIVEGNNTPP